MGPGQVFWLVARPTPHTFPASNQAQPVASREFRPHIQRRDRRGFPPLSLDPGHNDRRHSKARNPMKSRALWSEWGNGGAVGQF
jgi:hypothetical protein